MLSNPCMQSLKLSTESMPPGPSTWGGGLISEGQVWGSNLRQHISNADWCSLPWLETLTGDICWSTMLQPDRTTVPHCTCCLRCCWSTV